MPVATFEPGGIVWAKRTRICQLDNEGNVIPGNSVFVTEQLMKATITPVNEAGDAIAIKNASGALGVYALKGDIPKWYTVAIEMVYPDPQIEALLCGGTVFSDTATAFGAPSGAPTVTAVTTGGTLTAGPSAYQYTGYSVFGRGLNSPSGVVTNSGSTSQNVISGFVFPSGSLGVVVFGRTNGQIQALGTVPNVGSQATSAASGTGTVTTLTVTALTEALPAGMTFTITGDTNSPKIPFTVLETAGIGETVVSVSAPTVTTTIAAAAIVPVFVDNGSISPSGVPNVTDRSGGPGTGVGQQAPATGIVAGPNISIEFFMELVDEGTQDAVWPYVWIVLPLCSYFVVGARDVTNAELQAVYTGTAFPNPNWGAGPSGQFPFDSSEILQWTACGEDVVPAASYAAQAAG